MNDNNTSIEIDIRRKNASWFINSTFFLRFVKSSYEIDLNTAGTTDGSSDDEDPCLIARTCWQCKISPSCVWCVSKGLCLPEDRISDEKCIDIISAKNNMYDVHLIISYIIVFIDMHMF